MDRLASMDVFVKAVDLGSFAATADALEISAPMVGKHIRFLEDRLGVRLLNRTTRRQSVTEFGRDYYERCRRILAEAEAADALATSEMFEPRGTLRVTASVHFGRHCVMPILTELLGQYPRLQLDLSLTDRLADLAEDGLDLAVRTGEPVAQAGMVGRRVARQRMIVCAAKRTGILSPSRTSAFTLAWFTGAPAWLRRGSFPQPTVRRSKCSLPPDCEWMIWRRSQMLQRLGPDSRGSPPGSSVPDWMRGLS